MTARQGAGRRLFNLNTDFSFCDFLSRIMTPRCLIIIIRVRDMGRPVPPEARRRIEKPGIQWYTW